MAAGMDIRIRPRLAKIMRVHTSTVFIFWFVFLKVIESQSVLFCFFFYSFFEHIQSAPSRFDFFSRAAVAFRWQTTKEIKIYILQSNRLHIFHSILHFSCVMPMALSVQLFYWMHCTRTANVNFNPSFTILFRRLKHRRIEFTFDAKREIFCIERLTKFYFFCIEKPFSFIENEKL